VTAEQLGFAPVVSAAPERAVRDAESLVSMLDDAASLLDQLGAAGSALAPQMLSAWKDTVTSRRTMLGLLDPAAADPAGHARAATATVTELEQLAESRVIFSLEAYQGKVWITSYDCPFTCEAILDPAQADSLIDLITQTTTEARGDRL
jgi:hypothetical protein